ncbi:MAG: hypothetical protein Q8930_04660 [Bacillota bacterium]|nr:hypothetical protein [Bacillota bacterium]
MALSYTREYKRIIDELAEGILKIHKFYEFFEMEERDWNQLSHDEKCECAKTLADDVFYALGRESFMNMCDSIIQYDEGKGLIAILEKDKVLEKIYL